MAMHTKYTDLEYSTFKSNKRSFTVYFSSGKMKGKKNNVHEKETC